MANARVIPASVRKPDILRVAAYCRVSSNSEDQLHSYAAQIRNYTEVIRRHRGWKLIDVYADEAVTGTDTEKRDEFNRMLADCRKGKIDRILVKSISRFARNTRDCLVVLRELSLLDVAVYFEKENIGTDTLTTEFMVSVYSSLAQEESVSISQNQRISYQRRMESGEFITCKAPFGYRMPDRKNLVIEPEEAEVVRWIYDSYLNGRSAGWIAAELTRRGIPTADDKPRWRENVVLYILTNEKYIGDSRCQKKYSVGFPFQKRVNHGERTQYYVEQTHPPIISPDVYQRTRELMQKRAERERSERQAYPLTRKVRCGHCGSVFSRKVSANGAVRWGCRKHEHGAEDCPIGRIPETLIYQAFVRMYNRLRENRDIVLQPAVTQLETLNDILQRKNPEILAVNKAIAEANEQAYNLNRLQASGLLDANICAEKLAEIASRMLRLRRERRQVLQNDDIEDAAAVLRETMRKLEDGPKSLKEFDAALFAGLVDTVTVDSETSLRFLLYGGYELTERMEAAE
ncbi:MAG: recombinase family protein [Oscillibacter sp.]|nr:recombinase family protein [Oscillibacter sp.]